MRLCVLGSGSGGNCSVIDCGGVAVFIDAGFGPLTTQRRLAQTGLAFEAVAAVLLTHLDRDHFRPSWLPTLLRRRIVVCVHRWHEPELLQLPGAAALRAAGLVTVFDAAPFEPIPGLTAAPIRLQHDRQGTCGFRLSRGAAALGYATDLGHVPEGLLEHFAGVHVLALESNYDPMMEMSSARPFFLKRRIMNGSGHLSNEQCFEAVRHIATRCPAGGPRHVVLLHRSRDCNHPRKVTRLYADHPTLRRRLILADQRRRSRWVPIAPPARPRPRLTEAPALFH